MSKETSQFALSFALPEVNKDEEKEEKASEKGKEIENRTVTGITGRKISSDRAFFTAGKELPPEEISQIGQGQIWSDEGEEEKSTSGEEESLSQNFESPSLKKGREKVDESSLSKKRLEVKKSPSLKRKRENVDELASPRRPKISKIDSSLAASPQVSSFLPVEPTIKRELARAPSSLSSLLPAEIDEVRSLDNKWKSIFKSPPFAPSRFDPFDAPSKVT